MRTPLLLFLLSCSLWLTAGDFCLWARMTFEEPGLAFSDASNLVMKLPVQPQNPTAGSYLAMRYYPPNGGKSSLRKLAVHSGDSTGPLGHSLTPGEDLVNGELLLLLDHIGELKAAPDLMLAFKVFLPKDDHGEYRLTFWNCSRPGKCSLLLNLKPGQWNVVRAPLIFPGAIDTGDIVRHATFYSRTARKRNWLFDDYIVWSGKDPQPPEPVSELKVTARGDDNLLSWRPSQDNLAIAHYAVHRGTVPDFAPSQATLAGQTIQPHFTDVSPMHENCFYKVIAIDYADNPSAPSLPVRR